MFDTVVNGCTPLQNQLAALVPPFNMSNSSVSSIALAVSAQTSFVESVKVEPMRGIK